MIFNLVISLLHLFHVIDSIMMDISIGYGVLELFVAVLAVYSLFRDDSVVLGLGTVFAGVLLSRGFRWLYAGLFLHDNEIDTYFYFLQCRRRKENSIKKKRAELGAILSMYFYRLLHAL